MASKDGQDKSSKCRSKRSTPGGKLQVPKSELHQDFEKLYANPILSDFEVHCKMSGKVWKAHRAILAARSEYFRAAIMGPYVEAERGKIVLHDDCEQAIDAVLQCIYTGRYALSVWHETRSSEHLKVAAAMDKYQMPFFRDLARWNVFQTLTMLGESGTFKNEELQAAQELNAVVNMLNTDIFKDSACLRGKVHDAIRQRIKELQFLQCADVKDYIRGNGTLALEIIMALNGINNTQRARVMLDT